MSDKLSTTSYALLGMLAFNDSADGLTGYELKQRADITLRFYWTSPAMSQIYSELNRLARTGLAEPTSVRSGRRNTRRYRITRHGTEMLDDWLATSDPEFPTLKHPVALRLLLGARMSEADVREMLETYRARVRERNCDLAEVREMLGDAEATRFPALVADWGLAFYASELECVDRTLTALDRTATD